MLFSSAFSTLLLLLSMAENSFYKLKGIFFAALKTAKTVKFANSAFASASILSVKLSPVAGFSKMSCHHCLLLQKSNSRFMDYEKTSGNVKLSSSLGSTLERYISEVTCLVPRPDIFVSVAFSGPFAKETLPKTLDRGLKTVPEIGIML